MRKAIPGLVVGAVLLAAGCDTRPPVRHMQPDPFTRPAYFTAATMAADRDWRVMVSLSDATAGTLVARHRLTHHCAYARGDGSFYALPCRRHMPW